MSFQPKQISQTKCKYSCKNVGFGGDSPDLLGNGNQNNVFLIAFLKYFFFSFFLSFSLQQPEIYSMEKLQCQNYLVRVFEEKAAVPSPLQHEVFLWERF